MSGGMTLDHPSLHITDGFKRMVAGLPDIAQTEVVASLVGLQRFRLAREHACYEGGGRIYSRPVQAAGLDLRVLVAGGPKDGRDWIVAIGVFEAPIGNGVVRDAEGFWATWRPPA